MTKNKHSVHTINSFLNSDNSISRRVPLIGIPCQTILSTGAGELSIFSVYQNMSIAIEKAGGIAIMIPPYESDSLKKIYKYINGLLLDGGADIDPHCYGENVKPKTGPIDWKRDQTESTLIKWAMEDDLPVLGICRGMQMINTSAGGTLFQDISLECSDAGNHSFHPAYPPNYLAHAVSVKSESRLHKSLGCTELWVNSMHHQAVKTVAPGFHITATAIDGIIEGIESDDLRFVIGVQWHPEEMIENDDRMFILFKSFIEACQYSL